MKRYRVTIYVGDDKQLSKRVSLNQLSTLYFDNARYELSDLWMFVYANSKDEAISNAKDSISVLSVEEVSETGL